MYECDICGQSYEFESVLRKHKYTCKRKHERTTNSSSNSSKRPTKNKLHPCPLTEYYEAFRLMYTLIDNLLKSSRTGWDEDNLSDPTVQYKDLLGTFVGDEESTPSGVNGYGPQHTEKVDFRVQDYREMFGNSDWITDFQCIEVEEIRPQYRQVLETNDVLGNEPLIRPTTPQTGVPVPGLVETNEELSLAMSILMRFPAEPALSPEDSNSEDRFPIIFDESFYRI